MRRVGRCVWILIVGLVSACGSVPPDAFPVIGTKATIDVATWNLERFGNDRAGPDEAVQIENVGRVIREAGIEIWALQEIEDFRDLDALVYTLGSEWAVETRPSSTNLHLAFIYRGDAVRAIETRQILKEHGSVFAGRPPLVMRAEVSLPGGETTLTLINLHMKAFSDPASWQKRVDASRILKEFLDSDSMRDEPIVVLGDFNDGVTSSIRIGAASPFTPFVADAESYRFSTSTLEERGEGTYCFTETCESKSVVDHILITDELFEFDPHGAVRYTPLLDVIDDYTTTTSDHLPAVVRLQLVADR